MYLDLKHHCLLHYNEFKPYVIHALPLQNKQLKRDIMKPFFCSCKYRELKFAMKSKSMRMYSRKKRLRPLVSKQCMNITLCFKKNNVHSQNKIRKFLFLQIKLKHTLTVQCNVFTSCTIKPKPFGWSSPNSLIRTANSMH